MKEYNEQVVETLDDAGCIIANKNIIIDNLQARIAELEERRCEICGYAEHHREHTGCLRTQLTTAREETDQLRQRVQELEKQRDELSAATEAIAINSEECLDFDECTAMLVSIDDYHRLMEAVARAKGEQ